MAADRPLEVPTSIRQVLDDVRQRIRFRVLIDGLLLAVICVLGIFWLGGLLDYVPVTLGSNETPAAVRLVMLVIMSVLLAWALLWRLARSYLAPLRNHNLAVLLERHFPELNNELVTVVDLAARRDEHVSNPAAYGAMLERVQQSAAGRVQQLSTGQLINWKPVWLQAWLAAGLGLLTLAMLLAQPAWMNLWFKRLFTLSEDRWPRMARLEIEGVLVQLPAFTGQLAADRIVLPFEDHEVSVPRGGAVTLNVKADNNAQLVPELCTIFYQTGDGARGRANMRRMGTASDGWQAFMLDGPPLVDLSSDLTFDIVGGDARLDDYVLRAIDPAVINSVKLEVTYPSYLLASKPNLPPKETLEFRSGLRIPEGTIVTLKGTASGVLKSVQYVVRTASASATEPKASDSKATEDAVSGSEVIVQSVTPVGREFDVPLGVVHSTQVIEIRILDEDGITGDQIPRYTLAVTEDTVPEVEARLVGIGTAVTPKAVLPLDGKALDDNGLDRVWTTVVVNELPPVEIDVPVDNDGKLAPRIDLLELRETGRLRVAPNSTLGLAISATDRFDLNGIKHVGNGQPIQLAVVDESKMLVIIDRQELELRQRLELIISELTQLRDVLKEQASTALPGAALKSLRAQTMVSLSQPPASAGKNESEAVDDTPATGRDPEQMRRLMLLRAQQSVVQGDKSQQELIGLAGLVDDIRLQLINNRIDSRDRQVRLQEKVHAPLKAMLASEMEALRNRLAQFQSAAVSPGGGPAQAALAAEENERVLAALNGIVANMLDLESFNELVDEFRKLVDDQGELLKATETQRKQDIIESLKGLQSP